MTTIGQFDVAAAAEFIAKLMNGPGAFKVFGWDNRPLNNMGQKVEDGDRVILRVCMALPQSLSSRDIGDLIPRAKDFDISGNSQIYIKLQEINGMKWVKAEKGNSGSAAHFTVRKSPEGNFTLVEHGTNSTLAHSGDWILCTTEGTTSDEQNASIGCVPTVTGYELHFQSLDRLKLMSGEFVNCKGEGKFFKVLFFSM